MKWVSVKDREPRNEFKYPEPDVLFFYPGGIKIGTQWQDGQWYDDHIYSIEGVTHWMPLPEPPKD